MDHASIPTVTVERFYLNHAETLQLKLIAGGGGLSRKIQEGSVNRPGLALAGFFRFLAVKRGQVIGGSEWQFIKFVGKETAIKPVQQLPRGKIPCIIFARNINVPAYLLELFDREQV